MDIAEADSIAESEIATELNRCFNMAGNQRYTDNRFTRICAYKCKNAKHNRSTQTASMASAAFILRLIVNKLAINPNLARDFQSPPPTAIKKYTAF